MGDKLKKIVSIAAPVVGGAVGGPPGAAIGGAVGGAAKGGGLKGALIGAGTGFAGNVIGNSIAPTITGSLAKAGASNTFTNSLANSSIGRMASNVIGPATGASLIGNAAGGFAGNTIAEGLGESLFPTAEEESSPSAPAPYSPTRQAQLDLPGSLSGFSGLDESQLSSNIATQGVYGGGQGPQEEDFFTNMINRRLIDDAGNTDQDLSEINPIESSYLSQLGLGGYTDPRSLLEAISKRKQAM